MRNSETEMRWVDAWNELYDIVRDRYDVPCELPDWSVVDVEACRGWLQESTYAGVSRPRRSGLGRAPSWGRCTPLAGDRRLKFRSGGPCRGACASAHPGYIF